MLFSNLFPAKVGIFQHNKGMTGIPHRYAVVDLGSNSFHALLAEYHLGQLYPVGHHHQRVGLLSGFVRSGCLLESSIARAVAAAHYFAPHLRDILPQHIWIAGTEALRRAPNAAICLSQMEAAFQHEIQVLSGLDEAQLIYQAVFQHEHPTEPMMVIDIGGGSTECIVGQGLELQWATSMPIGCITLSEMFFSAHKHLDMRQWHYVGDSIKKQLKQHLSTLPCTPHVWIGTSGTLTTTETLLNQLGLQEQPQSITAEALHALITRLSTHALSWVTQMEHILGERRGIFLGGLRILTALFEHYQIPSLKVSHVALREGMLHKLIQTCSSLEKQQRQ
jgi:exopolyphosphatase/guanosine-5'-triphosphate,3'-diphosphate pyrophosphatase